MKAGSLNKMEDPRLGFLSMISPLHQDNVIRQLILLIDRLRAQRPLYHPAILDLSCLLRTLLQIQRLEKEQICRGYLLSLSTELIHMANMSLESLFAVCSSKVVDEASVLHSTQQTLFALNRFLSMTRLYDFKIRAKLIKYFWG